MTPACFGNAPGGLQAECPNAMTACASTGGGVLLYVFRRDRAKPGSPWVLAQEVCSGTPGAPPAPALLTPELVQDAFEHLPFTPAAAAIQPAGGRTLVNLTTYFHATYPRARVHGHPTLGPGQPATLTLLGHHIAITPHATSYRYHFDDGPALASPDPGGPYPTGQITHTYPRPGRRTTRIDTTYGGTFTIDGGPPIPLQGTVTIPGANATLDVLTATNRLYANP